MPLSLTFVIIARNEEKNIPRVIRSIQNVAGGESTILVVDHGSHDGTKEVAMKFGAAEVLPLEGGTISEARNLGGFAVETEWMVFIDADCELSSDWMNALEPHLETSGVYGWPVSPPQPPTWVQSAWHTHWMQKVRRREAGEIEDSRPWAMGDGLETGDRGRVAKETGTAQNNQGQRTKNQEQVESGSADFRLITTANMIIHRDVFQKLKGFDPQLASGEDQNFMLRAMKEGVRIQALPGLDVVHHGEPRTLKDFYRQQLWHANRGSYSRIIQQTGLKQGGNAPLFTLLYLLTLGLAVLGLVGVFFSFCFMVLCLPWLGLILLPASRTATRAQKLRWIPALSILYAAYGLARSLDLVGLNPVKRSWRS